MFDIASLAIQESTVLHLAHPVTGEKLFADKAEKQPITITVASTSSRAYRQVFSAMHARSLKRGNKKRTLDESRAESIELLAACCLDAANLVYKGKPVKTDDAFSWLRSQVDEALGNVELFIA